MKLTGNTVLITGGTSGIGYALAAEFLKRGNTVLVTGRTEDRLAATRAALPGLHTFVCDQADPAAVRRLCAEVTAAFPALNVLINNAGIGWKLNLNDASRPMEDLGQEIATNITGPIQLIHGLLPQLKRHPDAVIVNVTSGLAFVPLALKPIYSATKAAMHAYTQSLRAQLALTSVKVVELAPPAVATEFNKGQEDMNAGPRMDVKRFAKASMRGLGSGRDEVLPGPSGMLVLMRRLFPHMVLRKADAAKMGVGR